LRGKVVFSSVHQSKGRQRPLVFVFGFDQTYFDIFDRDNVMPRTECPDLLYVAATRAERELILIQDERKAPCSFFCKTLEDIQALPTVKILGSFESVPDASSISKPYKTSVTDLVKHIHTDAMSVLTDYLAEVYTCTQEPSIDTNIPSTITTSLGLEEDVSDINGVILPAIQEYERTGSSTILNTLRFSRKKTEYEDDEYIRSVDDTDGEGLSALDWISVGIEYISRGTRLLHKQAQIPMKDRRWLSNGEYRTAVNFLHRYMEFLRNVEYEVSVKCNYSDQYCGRIELSGRLDVKSDTTLLEIKCTNDLTVDHKLQLLVYAWMYRKSCSNAPDTSFRLLNIRTGEEYTLDASYETLSEIVAFLIAAKYSKQVLVSDQEFVHRHSSDRIKCKAVAPNVFDSDDEEPVIREKAVSHPIPSLAPPKLRSGPMDKFIVRGL
jgi:hypothetical protein